MNIDSMGSWRSAPTLFPFVLAAGMAILVCQACQAVQLGRSARKGENTQYRITAHYTARDTMALPETHFDLDVTYRQSITNAESHGGITLELRPVAGTLKQEGGGDLSAQIDPKKAPQFTAEVDRSGRLTKFGGLRYEGPPVGVWGAVDIVPLYNWFVGFSGFPGGDLAVGDSWGQGVAVNFVGVGKFQVTSLSKLVKVETVDQRRCAVIESTVSVPCGQMSDAMVQQAGVATHSRGNAVVTTTNYVDVADGMLIRSEGRFETKIETTISAKSDSGSAESMTSLSNENGAISVTRISAR